VPIFYECDRCTACCRWPGQVRLQDGETAAIAAHLKLTEAEFIDRYTRLDRHRTGLALTDQADGSCVFLDGADCRINPVKPQQCREFPNLWNFPGFQEVCQARPVVLGEAEWRERIRAATGREATPPLAS
jgi:uncharacterized protein